MTRLILAEDHLIVRKGLLALLSTDPTIEVIAEAGDGFEAAELTEKLKPDVLLLDLALPRLHGVSVIRRVTENTRARTVILSMHSDGLNVRDALAAGALGYVLKESSPEELLSAIRAVMRGDPFVSQKLRRTAMDAVLKLNTSPSDPCSALTPRERLVLENSAAGLTNAQIAEKLFISSRTVESHRSNLMKKLKLANQTDLVRFSIRQGILAP